MSGMKHERLKQCNKTIETITLGANSTSYKYSSVLCVARRRYCFGVSHRALHHLTSIIYTALFYFSSLQMHKWPNHTANVKKC